MVFRTIRLRPLQITLVLACRRDPLGIAATLWTRDRARLEHFERRHSGPAAKRP